MTSSDSVLTTRLPADAEAPLPFADLPAYLLVFDSNLAPIVGQQVTLGAGNAATVGPRIDLMIARANLDECDLVAKTRVAAKELGFLYQKDGTFQSSLGASPPLQDAALRQIAILANLPLTYTCAPPGSGERIALDRDEDGFLDGDVPALVAGVEADAADEKAAGLVRQRTHGVLVHRRIDVERGDDDDIDSGARRRSPDVHRHDGIDAPCFLDQPLDHDLGYRSRDAGRAASPRPGSSQSICPSRNS